MHTGNPRTYEMETGRSPGSLDTQLNLLSSKLRGRLPEKKGGGNWIKGRRKEKEFGWYPRKNLSSDLHTHIRGDIAVNE